MVQYIRKNCTKKHGYKDAVVNKLFQLSEQKKHTASDTYYYVNNDYAMLKNL